MNEKICEHCRFLLTVTTATGGGWYECFLKYCECPVVELNETCKRWRRVTEESKIGEDKV